MVKHIKRSNSTKNRVGKTGGRLEGVAELLVAVAACLWIFSDMADDLQWHWRRLKQAKGPRKNSRVRPSASAEREHVYKRPIVRNGHGNHGS